MTSENRPWRHHYLPQFLLRGWVGNDGLVESYSRPYREIVRRRVAPRAIGFEKALYATADQAFELESTFFKWLDTQAAAVLGKIKSGLELSLDFKVVWVLFLRSLMHRTPTDLMRYKSAAAAYIPQQLPELEAVYDQKCGAADPYTFEEFAEKYLPMIDEKIALKALPKILLNKEVFELMISLPWHCVQIKSNNHSLLISDAPIVRSNGITKPFGHLAMPIGPREYFLVTYDDKIREAIRQMTDSQVARAINSEVVGQARMIVVAEDARQSRFIENRMGRM